MIRNKSISKMRGFIVAVFLAVAFAVVVAGSTSKVSASINPASSLQIISTQTAETPAPNAGLAQGANSGVRFAQRLNRRQRGRNLRRFNRRNRNFRRPARRFNRPAARRGLTNKQSQGAISAGKAASLGQVARSVRRRVPGQLLDARLMKGRNGNLIYRLKILGKNGVVRDVTADAYTGNILSVR